MANKRPQDIRVQEATKYLEDMRERLMFCCMRIRVANQGKHWRFYKRGKFIASFWPGGCKLQLQGEATPRNCKSAAKATYLAAQHSQRLWPERLSEAPHEGS